MTLPKSRTREVKVAVYLTITINRDDYDLVNGTDDLDDKDVRQDVRDYTRHTLQQVYGLAGAKVDIKRV